MASVFIRGKDAQRHRKGGHGKTKAGTEVMQLQVQDHRRIPGAIRS